MSNFNENNPALLVMKLINYLRDLQPQTLVGQNYVKESYEKIVDSLTPLHDIRIFVNQIGADDQKLKDNALKEAAMYIQTLIKGSSSGLGFKFALAREEHILEMYKLGVQNPLASLESIEDSFHYPDAVLRELLKNGHFDSLHSTYLQKIKDQENIQTDYDKLSLNGYNAVLSSFVQAFKNTEAQTEVGASLLKKTFSRLLESQTPMLELKEFVTNAEELEAEDIKLKELVNFIKKKSAGNDLNYLINLCKEEHFANLNRSGHPNPKDTIKDIEKYLQLPGADIDELIRKGAFDNLQSKLLNDVKANLGIEVVQDEIDLNESAQITLNGLVHYHPVGFVADDDKFGKVLLVEHDSLIYDKSKNMISLAEGFVPNTKQQRMIDALQQLQYDPEVEEFSLNESWLDFEMKYNTLTDKVKIRKLDEGEQFMEIPKEKVKQFLMESIQAYKQTVPGFNPAPYLKDGDNMIMLLENTERLVKFNNLKVIRNLNESNQYGMVHLGEVEIGKQPKYFANGNVSLFESYNGMVRELSDKIKLDCSCLFGYEIQKEMEITENKTKVRENLIEEQKRLNGEISKVDSMLKIVERGSASYNKTLREKAALQKELDNVLIQLKRYV